MSARILFRPRGLGRFAPTALGGFSEGRMTFITRLPGYGRYLVPQRAKRDHSESIRKAMEPAHGAGNPVSNLGSLRECPFSRIEAGVVFLLSVARFLVVWGVLEVEPADSRISPLSNSSNSLENPQCSQIGSMSAAADSNAPMAATYTTTGSITRVARIVASSNLESP